MILRWSTDFPFRHGRLRGHGEQRDGMTPLYLQMWGH